MLPIKSKYKIGKRLGPGVFEQLQTQKFALSEARSKNRREKRGRRGGSDYGRQLLEKQRLRFTYGLSERQLANYVKKATSAPEPSVFLHRALEMRADNIVYRAGLAPTRRAARQMVSHGHINVNDRRITVPSYTVRIGDVITVREASRAKTLFAQNDESEAGPAHPSWLTYDRALLRIEIKTEPMHTAGSGIDYATVFEFYSR
ncbi:MAG: 30S ribosomal protein S4 [Parcubacteria group bacterium GW2011_GWA2_51_10]|nr:MAG: 30S ribosomal protein S4 [Parcubacteria group bacterium GW2011_GWA2_51_10]